MCVLSHVSVLMSMFKEALKCVSIPLTKLSNVVVTLMQASAT